MIYGDAAKSLVQVDWTTIDARRADWTRRWNEGIER